MIEQQGQVVAAGGGHARVRLGGRAGCPACDAGRGCGAGLFGRLLRRRPLVLSLDNHLGVTTGQAVVVGLPEAWFLGLVARFYFYPLLAGLAGGAVGHYVCRVFDSGTAVADLVTLCGAVLGAAMVFWRDRRLSGEFPGAVDVHLLRVVDGHKSDDD